MFYFRNFTVWKLPEWEDLKEGESLMEKQQQEVFWKTGTGMLTMLNLISRPHIKSTGSFWTTFCWKMQKVLTVFFLTHILKKVWSVEDNGWFFFYVFAFWWISRTIMLPTEVHLLKNFLGVFGILPSTCYCNLYVQHEYKFEIPKDLLKKFSLKQL